MTKIHHMTVKKAERKGFTLEVRDDKYLVRKIDGGDHVLAIHENAHKAMEQAETDPMLPPTDGSVVKAKYKRRYGKDASCQDAMALAVNEYIRTDDGIDIEKLDQLARDNGLDPERWADRNVGQKSMSIRNCLRGMHRRGERTVVVGEHTFEPETTDEKVAA